MKDLGKRQREMRERMKQEGHLTADDAPATVAPYDNMVAGTESTDVLQLKKRLAVLEAENAKLRSEIETLRQKTVYVERQKSPDEARREQQHNYFKYSNARRW